MLGSFVSHGLNAEEFESELANFLVCPPWPLNLSDIS